MDKLVIMDNVNATLWLHSDTKIVHHFIKKYIFGESLRDLLSKGADEMIKSGAIKWLSDDRNNNALTESDGEWAKNIWFPRCLKAGWKFWAIVMPEKVIGQMNLKQFVNQYAEAGVAVQVFADPDEALKWLTSR